MEPAKRRRRRFRRRMTMNAERFLFRRSACCLALALLGSALAPSSALAQDGSSEEESASNPCAGEGTARLEQSARALPIGDGRIGVWRVVASCHERAGRTASSMRVYEIILREAATLTDTNAERTRTVDEVRGLVEALGRLLSALRVELSGAPRADIWVDGEFVGTAPGVVRVTPGTHQVVAIGEFGESGMREVSVEPRRTLTVQLTVPTARRPTGLFPPAAFWAVSATAVISFAGAVIFGAAAVARYNDVTGRLNSPNPAVSGSVTRESADAVNALASAADVVGAISAVLMATSIVLYFHTDFGDVSVAPNGAGLDFRLQF